MGCKLIKPKLFLLDLGIQPNPKLKCQHNKNNKSIIVVLLLLFISFFVLLIILINANRRLRNKDLQRKYTINTTNSRHVLIYVYVCKFPLDFNSWNINHNDQTNLERYRS
jgi:hypothetical protein